MPTDASWISRPWLQQSSEDLSLLCGFVKQLSKYPCFAMDVYDLLYNSNNIRFPFPKPSHSTYAPARPWASLPLNPPTILLLNHSSLSKPLHHDLQQRALLLGSASSSSPPFVLPDSINLKNVQLCHGISVCVGTPPRPRPLSPSTHISPHT